MAGPQVPDADAADILVRARASLHLSVIRFLGWSLSKVWRSLFSRVEVEAATLDPVRAALASRQPVVLLPSHRSHADYLMLSYIFFGYNLPVPCIAAGDNLGAGAVGALLRRAGAFFIRRTWHGAADAATYRDTLRSYVHRLLVPPARRRRRRRRRRGGGGPGLPLEFFLEGGRTRDGVLRRPMTGLLAFVAESLALSPAGGGSRASRSTAPPDAVLVPISLTYDRVPEGGDMARQRLGKPKTPETTWSILHTGLNLLRGRGGPPRGQVYVRCGAPLPMRALLEAGGEEEEEEEEEEESGPAADRVQAVADRVQAATVAASVVPTTAFVAASVLSWHQTRLQQGARRYRVAVAEVLDDVLSLARVARRRGAVLPGDWSFRRSRARHAVLRACAVLELPVDGAQCVDFSSVANELAVRLEFAGIRNQAAHVVAADCFGCLAARDVPADAAATVCAVVLHRFRFDAGSGNPLEQERGEGGTSRGTRRLAPRDARMVLSAVQPALDAYAAVATFLDETGALEEDGEVVSARDLALRVQAHLTGWFVEQSRDRPWLPTVEVLALDTLASAVEWCRKEVRQTGPQTLRRSLQQARAACRCYHEAPMPVTALGEGGNVLGSPLDAFLGGAPPKFSLRW